MRSYKYFDIIMAFFVAVLITSNIASSAKIVDWGINLFGIPLALMQAHCSSPSAMSSAIFSPKCMAINVRAASSGRGSSRWRSPLWFCGLWASCPVKLHGINTQERAAYQSILGGMSTGGIVLASLSGYWLGEFFNSFVLAKMKVLTNGRWLWMRTIGSTLIGEAIDSVIFIAVASAFGVFPWSLFFTLTVTNYLFKVAIEAGMTPLTYLIVNALKRAENEDYYDRDTNFNPFTS